MGLDGVGVRRCFCGLMGAIAGHRKSAGQLGAAIDHFLKVTRSYGAGLFACYGVADLPRTNNELEQFFGSYRYHDRKLPFKDIAKAKNISLKDLIKEIESIVSSGTRLNISYYINDIIDEDKQDDIYDYFKTSSSDSLEEALAELGEDDYTEEEIRLMRIKFMSEFGN